MWAVLSWLRDHERHRGSLLYYRPIARDPSDGVSETGVLAPGNGVPRGTLDSIVARAGIPPRVLDETNVEHEISCETGEPLWRIVWHDVRLIGDEDPDTVIDRAYQRFLAIHESVVAHDTEGRHVQKARASLP